MQTSDGSSPFSSQTSSDVEAVIFEQEAMILRLALDAQLEKVRSLSFGDHLDVSFEYSVDEQLSELMLLISGYSEQVVQRALILTIGRPGDPEYTGRYPLHLACDLNAPFQVVQLFLQMEPTRQAVLHKDKWDDLPLHTACSRMNYTQVAELLLQFDPSKQSVLTKRYDGSLPIHTACRYNAPPKVIQLLLEADIHGETLLMDSLYGQLPLHVACRCNLHPDSLQLLLDYDTDKRSVLVQDEAGRLPLHAALKFCFLPGLSGNTASSPTTTSGTATDTATTTSTGTHKSSVELIFQAMLHGRVERIGLLQWKNEVIHKMIRPLEQASREEGDADTAFFLEESCKALNTLLQKAFLMELVVWKARCVGEYERCVQEHKDEHDVVSASVEAGVGMTATPNTETFNIMSFLSDHQKRGCRITSGADVIVPAVVSFLENEPVITLLAAAMR